MELEAEQVRLGLEVNKDQEDRQVRGVFQAQRDLLDALELKVYLKKKLSNLY